MNTVEPIRDFNVIQDMADVLKENRERDYVLFMTQDAVPKNKQLVSKLVSTLENDDDIAVVYGRQEPYKYCNTIESYARLFNYPEESFVNGIDDIDEKGIK